MEPKGSLCSQELAMRLFLDTNSALGLYTAKGIQCIIAK